MSDISASSIAELARGWFGYGQWKADYWFVGMEPGGDELPANLRMWVALGKQPLVDIRSYSEPGDDDWFSEGSKPQSTWTRLIWLLLTYKGEEPSPAATLDYQDLVSRVLPTLGPMLVAKIRPAHVQALYADLLTRCRICTRPAARGHQKCVAGLSSTSVLHLHTLLRAAFSWAVRMQIVARNSLDALAADAPQRTTPKTDAFTDRCPRF